MLRSFEVMLPSLSEMIKETNNLFCKDTEDSGHFVTAWVGFFEAGKKRLQFSSCGHPPALLKKRDGSLIELGTKELLLG